MKKPRLSLIAMLATIVALVSCGKGEPDEPVVGTESAVVTFEQAGLPDEGYEFKEGNEYTEAGITFNFHYEWVEEWQYVSWGGFAVSNLNNMETAGYTNDMSVYYNDGGAAGYGGSSQFAMVFVSNDNDAGYASFHFANGENHTVEYAYVTNGTYAYHSIKYGDELPTPAFGDGDSFVLTATGYTAGGAKTGAVDFYLADYRNGKSYICTEWTKFDLSPLGRVNKVVFTLDSTKKNEYGMLTPAYFCIDNVSYRRPVPAE